MGIVVIVVSSQGNDKLSSFSLWIILLPPSLPPFTLPLLISVTGAWFHWHGGSWLEGAGLPAMGV